MNHFVPDFDTSTDDDYVNVNSNSTKPIMGGEEDELMELLWQNGQVVVQNQRLNNTKKTYSSTVSLHAGEEGVAPATSTLHHHEQQQRELDQNLFIHEDEMTSWLHYPLRDDDFCSDLLFSASAPTTTTTTTTMTQTTAAKPPVSSSSVKPPVRNFMNFSRMRGDFTRPSVSKPIVRESTQVKPIATPSSAAEAEASVSGLTRRTDLTVNRGSDLTRRTDLTVNCGSSSAVAGDGRNTLEVNRKGKAVAEPASEIPGTSSSVMSKSEIEPVNIQPETEKTIVDERKRKGRETTIDDTESPSEETSKQGRGRTTCTKRSRAAEVHNLSERKRRDRINERMKALQELIPRCNKSDKASMLDEAIEYMKSLQLQVQMMSMGCGMMPMMYTGMQQQYMAMGMGMGMNQPLPPPPTFMPFPNMLAPQRPFPTQTHAPDPSRVYLPNQQYDPTSNQPQFPGYVDPYQQFRNLYPTQPPQFQNQATSYPSSSRVSSSKESEDQGNRTTG